MNSLKEILEFRRAVRSFSDQPIDAEVVKQCAEEAMLAPTAYGVQLYEMYHITNKDLLKKMAHACLDQSSATTAQQFVVFVTRQDLYKERAEYLLKRQVENVKRNSPAEKQASHIKYHEEVYKKIVPLLYMRFFGLMGAFRYLLSSVSGLFKPTYRQMTENDMRIDVHKNCALAAETFMLSMAEKGYDTCPMTGIDSLRVKRLLKLPYSAEINMVISCGIRSERGLYGERVRIPSEKLYKRI
jgi:nitroreductase family protein